MLELNKIHLGDSYELIKQIPDKSIDCIYVDVPYLYKKGGKSGLLFGKRMVSLHESLSEISDGFNYEILDEFVRVCKKINVFIWCSKQQLFDIMEHFKKYDTNFDLLVWCKTNPAPKNNSWNSDIEYCLVFREKNFPLNYGYVLKSKYFISPLNIEDKSHFEHPTIKPLDLVKRHLLHTTQENDIVLDCFSGSGTTCVACKELGRQFIGIEIDEKWHKISVERLNGINAKGQTSIFTDFDNL
jgi:DNA modification methylase